MNNNVTKVIMGIFFSLILSRRIRIKDILFQVQIVAMKSITGVVYCFYYLRDFCMYPRRKMLMLTWLQIFITLIFKYISCFNQKVLIKKGLLSDSQAYFKPFFQCSSFYLQSKEASGLVEGIFNLFYKDFILLKQERKIFETV